MLTSGTSTTIYTQPTPAQSLRQPSPNAKTAPSTNRVVSPDTHNGVVSPDTHHGSDNVQLSGSAQAALSVIQEATETAAQTAKEAGTGDIQAQHLIQKEAATRAAQ